MSDDTDRPTLARVPRQAERWKLQSYVLTNGFVVNDANGVEAVRASDHDTLRAAYDALAAQLSQAQKDHQTLNALYEDLNEQLAGALETIRNLAVDVGAREEPEV